MGLKEIFTPETVLKNQTNHKLSDKHNFVKIFSEGSGFFYL
jgi:hypothetical protein